MIASLKNNGAMLSDRSNIFYPCWKNISRALRHLDLTAHKLSAKLFLWLNANFRWFWFEGLKIPASVGSRQNYLLPVAILAHLDQDVLVCLANHVFWIVQLSQMSSVFVRERDLQKLNINKWLAFNRYVVVTSLLFKIMLLINCLINDFLLTSIATHRPVKK